MENWCWISAFVSIQWKGKQYSFCSIYSKIAIFALWRILAKCCDLRTLPDTKFQLPDTFNYSAPLPKCPKKSGQIGLEPHLVPEEMSLFISCVRSSQILTEITLHLMEFLHLHYISAFDFTQSLGCLILVRCTALHSHFENYHPCICRQCIFMCHKGGEIALVQ